MRKNPCSERFSNAGIGIQGLTSTGGELGLTQKHDLVRQAGARDEDELRSDGTVIVRRSVVLAD